ncbi:Tn3 family transposase [Permianibacter aggregans]|uniref:TnpA family transposase n=1 Tax=Permianibacter aggregans TaxID=1510150 RepID=A0A4R6UI22_9GAMM|nr:Tn3 family transposase [Permianibacter aggregans]TDQ45009.1 TnpA family transposase [Permianibacter aggregans]
MLRETAYPQLPAQPTQRELDTVFTPTADELSRARAAFRRSLARACVLVQWKLLQRLGYVVPLTSVPTIIIQHICRQAKLNAPRRAQLQAYDASGERSRHLHWLRAELNLRSLDPHASAWLKERAISAATSKQELPDIINVMLEELVRHRYELPGFTVLQRLARHARNQVNAEIFQRVNQALSSECADRLEQLLQARAKKSNWERLKREPKRPTVRELASYLEHLHWLRGQAFDLPDTRFIAATKRVQLNREAQALNVAEMRSLAIDKRRTLLVLLVQSQLGKAMDDIVEMFVKSMSSLHHVASENLKSYHLHQVKQTERLIGQFRDVLSALQQDEDDQIRVKAIEQALLESPDQLIAQCEEHMAFANNNYFPFMLRPYRAKRRLLLECLSIMQLRSSSQDRSLTLAVEWVLGHRHSRQEYLELRPPVSMPLQWVPERWRGLINASNDSSSGVQTLHRKYFELCVLTHVMQELKSGDLYLENSEQYHDFREDFISLQELDTELPLYSELVHLPANARQFTERLKAELLATATQSDEHFPDNAHVRFSESGLVLSRPERQEPPQAVAQLDPLLTDSLGHANILDVLAETERWLDLHKCFGPLSGFEAKIDDPRKRFITTLFCYGCNLGPSQTARSVKGLSRKQVAWLNLKYVTEERLDKAIVKVVNAFNRFTLPKFWGSGQHVSADGTKWSVYEQNLLSEYHIRYGGYGGIGYYHVSDRYIALFSHFIPCGVHEAVYILDGLLRNESEIQPDTVHGDTQAQSAPVFGLSYLLGIKLMPRIRNIKDLVFFRPDKATRYQHIDSLFRDSIDWELIERHYLDLMRVAISIKSGRITPSTLLRRLGTASRKNRLYYAFRELGRVVRTKFLLQYIMDIELRRTIHAATNKSEQFNDFAKWLFFGGQGIIAENIRHEQRKVIKYNHLVANMIILNNVHRMTTSLKHLRQSGFEINEKVLAALAPYRTTHINRFGDYTLDLERAVEPPSFGLSIL